MWRKNLDEAAGSKLAQAALAHIDDPEAARQAVADVIDSPGFAKMRARASRSLQTSDGRIVGVDATATEATDDWARAVVDHVNSLVRDPNGEIVGDLPAMLAGGEVPPLASLNEFPADRLPAAVKGREMVQVSRNWVRDVMDRGFAQVVGRPMDWMVRQPLFIHNYARRSEGSRGAPSPHRRRRAGATSTSQVAMDRAVNKTIPFIHDPQLRSQLAVNTRNLAPFWFAQEQFYKRWANIASTHPKRSGKRSS
jgi:hypothetical protein